MWNGIYVVMTRFTKDDDTRAWGPGGQHSVYPPRRHVAAWLLVHPPLLYDAAFQESLEALEELAKPRPQAWRDIHVAMARHGCRSA